MNPTLQNLEFYRALKDQISLQKATLDSSCIYTKLLQEGIQEEFEDIRFAALEALCVFCQVFPVGDENDLFVRGCMLLVNDISPRIRRKACQLLGSLRRVALEVLLQSFNKEPLYWSGDQQQSIVENAASGAFVLALEDEFEETRLEAIRAILSHCLVNAKFSQQATEFLLDMFNDEMEEVRIEAIKALIAIGKRYGSILLDEDGTSSCLVVFSDVSMNTRKHLYDFVRICAFKEAKSLSAVLHHFLMNINVFPHDKESIFESVYCLGKTNALVGRCIVPEVYPIDSKYLIPEPNYRDLFFCGKMLFLIGVLGEEEFLQMFFHGKDIRFFLLGAFPWIFQQQQKLEIDSIPHQKHIEREILECFHARLCKAVELRDLKAFQTLHQELSTISRLETAASFDFLCEITQLFLLSLEKKPQEMTRKSVEIYWKFAFHPTILHLLHCICGIKVKNILPSPAIGEENQNFLSILNESSKWISVGEGLTKVQVSLLLPISDTRRSDEPYKMFCGIPFRLQIALVMKTVGFSVDSFSLSAQMIEGLRVKCWQVGNAQSSLVYFRPSILSSANERNLQFSFEANVFFLVQKVNACEMMQFKLQPVWKGGELEVVLGTAEEVFANVALLKRVH